MSSIESMGKMIRAGCRRFGAFSVAFLVSGSVLAQTACPVGVPPGDPRCGPSPTWHPNSPASEAESAPEARVIERWEVLDHRFGAIALDPAGFYGASHGETSQREADAQAISNCEAKGGTSCRVIGSHRNGCSTLAWGRGKASADYGSTSEISERNALRVCEELAGAVCEVIETVCSPPVSRWVYEKPDDFVPAR